MSKLYQGDCLKVMPDIVDKSIDLILTDPPYGTTACKWDAIIPLDLMWLQLKRIIKDNGAIVLFGSEPFSSYLRMSNIKDYKYDWIWDKKIPSGMSYARFQPMRQHELISVFNANSYYPQMTKRVEPIKAGGMGDSLSAMTIKYEALKKVYELKNPTTIINFMKIRQDSIHPTQKPVELMEYLIKTYTKENEIILDFTMGSGTTGVACKQINRDFIGIELDKEYFNIAENRINKAVRQYELFTDKASEPEMNQQYFAETLNA